MLDALEMPRSTEAEQAVLGAILLDNSLLDAAAAKIRPEYFFADSHRRIFSAMLALRADGREIDPISLVERLKAAGDTDITTAYIASLFDGIPRFTNIDNYTHIVREKALLRHLMKWGNWLTVSAAEGGLSPAEIVQRAVSGLSDLSPTGDGLVHGSEAVDAMLARLEAEWAGISRRLETGFLDLDAAILGLEPGELIYIAGLRKTGKTTLALNMLVNQARKDPSRVFLMVSLEMGLPTLQMKLASLVSKIPLRMIRLGCLSTEDKEKFYAAADWIRTLNIECVQPDAVDVNTVGARIAQVKRKYGRLDACYLDYLQLLAPTGRKSMTEQVGEQSQGLKRLAVMHDVPLIALAGMNRDSERENRKPRLSDMLYGGERDADIVMMLHHPEPTDPMRICYIEKSRLEGDSVVNLGFRGDISWFFDLTRQEKERIESDREFNDFNF